MRVVKVMNNSLLLALDDNGREVILMGKGIGFNKSIGHRLKSEDIEKVFVLKDRSISKNILWLASEIDSTYFELAKQVIDYAIDTYKMVLMEHIYLGLTDHLSYAVKRNNEGILIQNFYTQTLKRFNPNEYQVGRYTLQLVREQLQEVLPEAEAGNIAFHFINAQTNNSYSTDNQKIFETVKGILDIVSFLVANLFSGLASAMWISFMVFYTNHFSVKDQQNATSRIVLFNNFGMLLGFLFSTIGYHRLGMTGICFFSVGAGGGAPFCFLHGLRNMIPIPIYRAKVSCFLSAKSNAYGCFLSWL